MFSVNDKDLKLLFNQLKDFETKLVKKELRKVTRKAIKPMLAATKEECPVDTGALRNSLKIRAGKSRKNVIRLQVQTSDQLFAGDQFYAGQVEFGFRHKKSGEMVQANPFMSRAFEKTKGESLAIFKTELKAAIERLTK